MLHLRHPLEMGGAYWLFTMIYTQLSIFIVMFISSVMGGIPGEENWSITRQELLNAAVILASLWLISFAVLLRFMNRWLRSTFYGKWTSKTFQRQRFFDGDDRTKVTILTTVHQEIWKGFEQEMRDWLNDVWEELHQTKPEWFTQELVKSIPREFTPLIREPSIREELSVRERYISHNDSEDSDEGGEDGDGDATAIRRRGNTRRRSSVGIIGNALFNEVNV